MRVMAALHLLADFCSQTEDKASNPLISLDDTDSAVQAVQSSGLMQDWMSEEPLTLSSSSSSTVPFVSSSLSSVPSEEAQVDLSRYVSWGPLDRTPPHHRQPAQPLTQNPLFSTDDISTTTTALEPLSSTAQEAASVLALLSAHASPLAQYKSRPMGCDGWSEEEVARALSGVDSHPMEWSPLVDQRQTNRIPFESDDETDDTEDSHELDHTLLRQQQQQQRHNNAWPTPSPIQTQNTLRSRKNSNNPNLRAAPRNLTKTMIYEQRLFGVLQRTASRVVKRRLTHDFDEMKKKPKRTNARKQQQQMEETENELEATEMDENKDSEKDGNFIVPPPRRAAMKAQRRFKKQDLDEEPKPAMRRVHPLLASRIISNLDPGDQYTPSETRGTGLEKQAKCPHCPSVTWLRTKSSQYNYHLNFCHGVSVVRRRCYKRPLAMTHYGGQDHHTAEWFVYCQGCLQWIGLGVKAHFNPLHWPKGFIVQMETLDQAPVSLVTWEDWLAWYKTTGGPVKENCSESDVDYWIYERVRLDESETLNNEGVTLLQQQQQTPFYKWWRHAQRCEDGRPPRP